MQGRNIVCLPLRVSRNESARTVKLEILRRFEYDSKLMLSGVVAKVQSSGSRCERAQVLMKGAPYEVSQLADPDSLPADWFQVSTALIKSLICHKIYMVCMMSHVYA